MIRTFKNSVFTDADFPAMVLGFRGSDQTVGSSVLVSTDGAVELPLSGAISSITDGKASFGITADAAVTKGTIPALGDNFLYVASGFLQSLVHSSVIGLDNAAEGLASGGVAVNGYINGSAADVGSLVSTNTANGSSILLASDASAVYHYEGDPADGIVDAIGAGTTATAIGTVTPGQSLFFQSSLKYAFLFKFTALPTKFLDGWKWMLANDDGVLYPGWAGLV